MKKHLNLLTFCLGIVFIVLTVFYVYGSAYKENIVFNNSGIVKRREIEVTKINNSTEESTSTSTGTSDSTDDPIWTPTETDDISFSLGNSGLKLVSEKSYGAADENDIFNSVVTSYDLNGNIDGYVAVGWSSSENIEGLINNGLIDAIIVKYDLNNNVIWQNNYGGSNDDVFNSITLSYDSNGQIDGYVVVGNTSSTDIEGITNNGWSDAIFIKYDLSGNIIWQRSYSGNYSEYFSSIIISNDSNGKADGYVVVGGSNSTDIEGLINKDSEDAIIIKYDLNGNLIWQKNYGGSNDDFFKSVTTSYDTSGKVDGFVTVGNTSSTDIEGLANKGRYDAIIVKYDLNGNVLWQNDYGGGYYDYFESVTTSYDTSGKVDGFVTVGNTNSEDIEGLILKGYYDAVIIKYDLNGNMIWQKSYHYKEYNDFLSIVESHDINGVIDGYVVAGYVNDDSYRELNGYAILIKYDFDGNLVYQQGYNNLKRGGASFIGITSSINGIVAVGHVDRKFNGSAEWYRDIYAVVLQYNSKKIKVDETSNINGKVEVNSNSVPGSTVEIKVNPSFGFTIDKIIITDVDNNVITVNDNKFVMPDSDVKVKVIYKRIIVNPETNIYAYMGVVLVFILTLGTCLVYKKRES